MASGFFQSGLFDAATHQRVVGSDRDVASNSLTVVKASVLLLNVWKNTVPLYSAKARGRTVSFTSRFERRVVLKKEESRRGRVSMRY